MTLPDVKIILHVISIGSSKIHSFIFPYFILPISDENNNEIDLICSYLFYEKEHNEVNS